MIPKDFFTNDKLFGRDDNLKMKRKGTPAERALAAMQHHTVLRLREVVPTVTGARTFTVKAMAGQLNCPYDTLLAKISGRRLATALDYLEWSIRYSPAILPDIAGLATAQGASQAPLGTTSTSVHHSMRFVIEGGELTGHFVTT